MSAKGSLNKVILIARLGHDPELKKTANGTAVATLRVATNEVWNKGSSLVSDRNWSKGVPAEYFGSVI